MNNEDFHLLEKGTRVKVEGMASRHTYGKVTVPPQKGDTFLNFQADDYSAHAVLLSRVTIVPDGTGAKPERKKRTPKGLTKGRRL